MSTGETRHASLADAPGTATSGTDLPEVAALVLGAMPEEVRPYSRRAGEAGPVRERGRARCQVVEIDGVEIMLVCSGIGMVNASAAAVTALHQCRPAAVISTGSAGGLGADVRVGDVVAGESYAYTQADATAFDGYVRGQIPGMPAVYEAGSELLAAARAVSTEAGSLRVGQMVSGDAFVTAPLVGEVREAFPDALSADMETTALAQIAYSYDLPYLSVRGISDLCGGADEAQEQAEQFGIGLDEAAKRSAAVVLEILRGLA